MIAALKHRCKILLDLATKLVQRFLRGGLVPGVAVRPPPRRAVLWKDRVAVGILRPSLNISKRSAPASGTASARRT
jgi:hypothetical protein